MMAQISAGCTIEGVTVYNPLPARTFVDLDKECILPLPSGKIHPFNVEPLTDCLDAIKTSGTLPNGVAWGITGRNEYGFADILIDAIEVTESTIRQLIAINVITRI